MTTRKGASISVALAGEARGASSERASGMDTPGSEFCDDTRSGA